MIALFSFYQVPNGYRHYIFIINFMNFQADEYSNKLINIYSKSIMLFYQLLDYAYYSFYALKRVPFKQNFFWKN